MALNLVPYIDLLVTLMAFLMISAAWTSFQALQATAGSGGGPPSTEPQPEAHTITVRDASTSGLEGLASLDKKTPIIVEVEDDVHHARIIEVLDVIAEQKLGAPTVRPIATP